MWSTKYLWTRPVIFAKFVQQSNETGQRILMGPTFPRLGLVNVVTVYSCSIVSGFHEQSSAVIRKLAIRMQHFGWNQNDNPLALIFFSFSHPCPCSAFTIEFKLKFSMKSFPRALRDTPRLTKTSLLVFIAIICNSLLFNNSHFIFLHFQYQIELSKVSLTTLLLLKFTGCSLHVRYMLTNEHLFNECSRCMIGVWISW